MSDFWLLHNTDGAEAPEEDPADCGWLDVEDGIRLGGSAVPEKSG